MSRLWLLVLLLAQFARATTLQELMDSDQLRLRSWLDPVSDIVPGQEVQLTIEISTRRWFAGGTHIRFPEVDQLVILQRDQFATNLSQREGSSTWVVQRWHLEIYPQAAGDFNIPPIALELAVNDARAGIVQGQLLSEPLSFSATLPPALQAIDRWLATPALNVTQSLDPQPQGLQAGDAFTREVVFSATRVTAMMLPVLEVQSPRGLSAYPELPRLLDRSNRGEAIAERTERIVYVVESPGQYFLPEQVFYWWDSDIQQLQVTSLPAITVDAGASAAQAQTPGPTAESDSDKTRADPRWLAIPLLLPLVYALFKLRRMRSPRQREKHLLLQVEKALHNGQGEAAARLLYDWLNHSQPRPDWYRLRRAAAQRADSALADDVSALIESVYSNRQNTSPDHLAAHRLGHGATIAQLCARWGLKPVLKPVTLDLNPKPPRDHPGSFAPRRGD